MTAVELTEQLVQIESRVVQHDDPWEVPCMACKKICSRRRWLVTWFGPTIRYLGTTTRSSHGGPACSYACAERIAVQWAVEPPAPVEVG